MVSLHVSHERSRKTQPIHPRPDISRVDVEGLRTALERELEGEVRFEAQARALYSTDASNYRQVPIGVVIPRSLEDVEKTVAQCRRFGAPLLNRGGGTSLAGQCCNVAIVIDFSKYLNRILELDAENRTAWVEPGCVLDDLRTAAAAHGLTYGPDPSTHNHCTLGGMVGNNACGVHSVMAGRTVDNIEALEILTYDGERMIVGPTTDEELAQIVAEGGRRAEIYAALKELRDEYAAEIRLQYPDIPRRVSGFSLDELLPEKGFHVARAVVGSEGTCVTILRIKCRLVPQPPERVLLVLGFPDVFAAGDAVPRVLKAGPVGLEGIDEELTSYMRTKHLHDEYLPLLPKGGGWLFVEFGGATKEAAEAAARGLMDALKESGDSAPSMELLTDPEEQSRLWLVREAGLPATAHVPGMRETHPGWEDSAVPPEKLGSYLRDFRKLLKEFDYHASLYGHFGDGCVHCRIDFDLSTVQGVETYHRFIERAADLVVSYGGSISGEHGDGQSRAELLTTMFGKDVQAAFHRFKEIWDPGWMMNPGKVISPYKPTENLREGPSFEPWTPEIRFALPEDNGDFVAAAARCVGVGECRKHESGVMCPSYMATYEEAYSTRGRARLLFEMTQGEVIRDGWRSEAVREALDLCLACKGCLDECPVNVDMAAYKAEFMHHHFKGRIRPRAAYSMGLIWWWARLGSVAPGLFNTAAHAEPLAGLAKLVGGFAPQRSIPRVADTNFRKWFKKRGTRAVKGNGADRRVLLWPDTFNTYFTPEPLKATVTVLEDAGWQVDIPEQPICCGRPLYAFGFLGLADRVWRDTMETLRPYIRADVPIVGLEPTCVAAFRDELGEMRPHDRDAKRLANQVYMLSEFLTKHDYKPPAIEGRAMLHAHCHHRAVMGAGPDVELLKGTGLDIDLLDDGCCGMAGDFGFRKETYDVAMKIGERAYLPKMRGRGEALFIADAFSCREQALQSVGQSPTTVPELLAARIR